MATMEDIMIVPVLEDHSLDGEFGAAEEASHLFQDKFLGVTLNPVLKPLDVAFVGLNSENQSESENNFVYTSSQSLLEGDSENYSVSGDQQQQQYFEDSDGGSSDYSSEFLDFQEYQEGNSWFTTNQDVTLLDGLVSESAELGSVDEFLSLVYSSDNSGGNLKNPMDIAKEIRREAEEFEARQSRSPSADSATTGSTTGSAETLEEEDMLDEQEVAMRPIISIPYDQLPEQYRKQLDSGTVMVQVESVPPKSRSAQFPRQDREDHSFGRTKKDRGQVKGQRSKVNKVERKKEQNREAATRYRMKRKDQKSGLCQEFEALEARNIELKKYVEDKEQEIAYIKGLLSEVRRRKK